MVPRSSAAVGGTADGTTTDGATLFDFIPIAFCCEPQILACHAADDDLYSLLVATQHAAATPWLSFIAASPHTRRDPHAVAAVVDACDGGVVVSLAGRGEPDEAIRPLLLSWNLLEICCARSAETPPQTDPYAPPQLPRVRLAITGVDDDVERHRAIAGAIQGLSSEHSHAAHEEAAHKEDTSTVQRLLREDHGGYDAVDGQVRELARRTFWEYYAHRPQHSHIRKLYELGVGTMW